MSANLVDLRRTRSDRHVLRHPVLMLAGKEYVWGRHEEGPGYWTAPRPEDPESLDMSPEACAERTVAEIERLVGMRLTV